MGTSRNRLIMDIRHYTLILALSISHIAGAQQQEKRAVEPVDRQVNADVLAYPQETSPEAVILTQPIPANILNPAQVSHLGADRAKPSSAQQKASTWTLGPGSKPTDRDLSAGAWTLGPTLYFAGRNAPTSTNPKSAMGPPPLPSVRRSLSANTVEKTSSDFSTALVPLQRDNSPRRYHPHCVDSEAQPNAAQGLNPTVYCGGHFEHTAPVQGLVSPFASQALAMRLGKQGAPEGHGGFHSRAILPRQFEARAMLLHHPEARTLRSSPFRSQLGWKSSRCILGSYAPLARPSTSLALQKDSKEVFDSDCTPL
jgi:hypothetical protein